MPRFPSIPGLSRLALVRSHGSFEEVRAYSEALQRPVDASIADPALVTEEFERRLQALQAIEHPGLQRTLVVQRLADGRWLILSDPAQGPSLAETLSAQGPLSTDDAVQIILELSQALAALHAQGLAHGNVAPENVRLPGTAAARRPVLTATALALAPANPSFRAPELEAGQPPTPAADVYSLGALLSAALRGGAPSRAEPVPRHALHLRELVARCLDARPEARPESVLALAEALGGLVGTRVSGGDLPQVSSEPPPTRLGQWEIEGILGQGSMGQVFRARHSLLGRRAAIKLLRSNQYRHTELIQRFFQEARTVNQVNHEHIVEISDFAQEGDERGPTAVYCVMELLEGETLSQRLSRGPLPLARALHIMRQVCKALAAAHRVGVVHRDVKADNIFLITRHEDPDYVKVLDFGVAKLTQGPDETSIVSTMDGAIIGTPITMAPEQASGGVVDARSDIYAVGVILYQLLSGHLPFAAENFAKLVTLLMTVPPAPLPERSVRGEPIPPELRELVLRCLAKRKEERPASMDEVAAVLSGATPGRARRGRALRRAALGAALLAAAGVGVGAGVRALTAQNVAQPAAAADASTAAVAAAAQDAGLPGAAEPGVLPNAVPASAGVQDTVPDAGEAITPTGAPDDARPTPRAVVAAKPILLTPKLATRIFMAHGPALRGCLDRNPVPLDTEARVRTSITVLPDGSVRNVQARSLELRDASGGTWTARGSLAADVPGGAALVRCLEARLAELRFPRITNGPRNLAIPVQLSVQGPR